MIMEGEAGTHLSCDFRHVCVNSPVWNHQRCTAAGLDTRQEENREGTTSASRFFSHLPLCPCLNNQSNKISFIITLRLYWTSEHSATCSLQVGAPDSTWSYPQIHHFQPFRLANEAENPAPQRSQVLFTASSKENYKNSSSFRTVALKFEPQQADIIQVLSTLQWHPAVFRIDFRVQSLVYTDLNWLSLSYIANSLLKRALFTTLAFVAAALLRTSRSSRNKITCVAFTNYALSLACWI